MSGLQNNVVSVRQRQRLNSGRAKERTLSTMTLPWATPGLSPGGMFMRSQPSLGQQSAAARYGATGLSGPTYGSMAAGATEPGPRMGALPNYATLKALALGQGRQSAWARQTLRKWAAQAQAKRRRRQRQRLMAELARRRGELLDDFEGDGE